MNYLEFKSCKRYNECTKQEHCPFDSVCELNCYFTNNKYKEAYNDLAEDYKAVSEECWSYEHIENELNEANNEISTLENKNEELYDLIYFCISKLNNEALKELDDKIISCDYYYHNIKEKIYERFKEI